jgi:hypothetical protein
MTSQYQRINPQEKTKSGGICVDRKAIMVFQYNVSQNLAFSVQRLGILYGTTDEEGWVNVQYIYEPPQENSADNIILLKNPDEEHYVTRLSSFFGVKKVGCIISQTVEDFSKSDDDEPFYLTAQQLLIVGEIHRDLSLEDPFIILSLGSSFCFIDAPFSPPHYHCIIISFLVQIMIASYQNNNKKMILY